MNGGRSNYPHKETFGLGRYLGMPFTSGSFNPHNAKTEIMNIETLEWSETTDYPFQSS